MTRKTLVLSIALLLMVTALIGCGRGAISSASNAAPTSPAATTTTQTAQSPAIANAQIWFVQLSSAVKNLDAVSEEVAQRVKAAIQQKIPALRALLLAVPTEANAKELFKDVRVRLVVTEKEYLTNSATTQPSQPKPKPASPPKKNEKKR